MANAGQLGKSCRIVKDREKREWVCGKIPAYHRAAPAQCASGLSACPYSLPLFPCWYSLSALARNRLYSGKSIKRRTGNTR
jgi:hypothetical protein